MLGIMGSFTPKRLSMQGLKDNNSRHVLQGRELQRCHGDSRAPLWYSTGSQPRELRQREPGRIVRDDVLVVLHGRGCARLQRHTQLGQDADRSNVCRQLRCEFIHWTIIMLRN